MTTVLSQRRFEAQGLGRRADQARMSRLEAGSIAGVHTLGELRPDEPPSLGVQELAERHVGFDDAPFDVERCVADRSELVEIDVIRFGAFERFSRARERHVLDFDFGRVDLKLVKEPHELALRGGADARSSKKPDQLVRRALVHAPSESSTLVSTPTRPPPLPAGWM